ncbi:hypothetical protein JCM6882_002981 [Rhodosporidiobolus microsporus]
MASSRASTSRFSLDAWADLAPLSAAESASIQRVSVAATDKAVPPQLAKQTTPSSSSFNPTSSSSASTAAPFPRSTPRARLDFSSSTPSASASRAGTPLLNGGDTSASASSTAGGNPSAAAAQHAALTDPLALLSLSGPIATTQQFHDFHSLVESSLEAAQESHYHTYLSTLSSHISTCSSLLSSLDAARGLISELSANEAYVSENSSALQAACEGMLEEQKHLLEVSEALTARLEYFRELERSVRLLNEPGEEVVLRGEFLEGLDRVGVCLEYLRANRDFHDAPLYLIRFQQCLTRSMALIKMYFVSTLKRTGEEVRGKMAGKDLSEPALHALLYQKFSALAPSLRLLLRELESRSFSPSPALSNPYASSPSSSSSHPSHANTTGPGTTRPDEAFDESYLPLLHDCLSTYTHTRFSLLAPLLAEEVRRMDPGRAELVGLAKTGCGYLRGVAMQEWELASGFFTGGGGAASEEIYRSLSHLCDTLYDSLRPRILHEPSLSTLCDLCGVLGAVMALDSDPGLAAAEGDDDEDAVLPSDEIGSPGSEGVGSPGTEVGSSRRLGFGSGRAGDGGAPAAGTGTGLGRLRFAALVAPILQDAQTRLVFRAQAVVQGEVVHYVPKAEAGEVDYPERLSKDKGERGEYATVRTTRGVLERLERCVDQSIFLDFAAEAVALCRSSLLSASTLIASRPPTEEVSAEERKQHAQLFLVANLVRVKEMVGGVELVRRERGVELGVKPLTVDDSVYACAEALASLLRNPTSAISSALFNPRAVWSAMPNLGQEVMVDAKMDLDLSLKTACETLISLAASSLTSPLRTFLDRCTAFLSSSPSAPSAPTPAAAGAAATLADQPWATPEEVLKLHDAFQLSLAGEARKVVERVRMYLAPTSSGEEGAGEEEKAVRVLVPPVVDEVVETYGTFYNLIRSEYGFATSSSLAAPADVGDKLREATQ